MAARPDAAGRDEEARRQGVLLAVVAVIAFSTSPIFLRLAAPLGPFEITTGRMALGAVAVWVLAWRVGQPLLPRKSDMPLFVLIGLITALHFFGYVASLSYTTIAHSLAITYTAPIFVAILSAWLLREPMRSRQWAGILVAVAGIAVLVGFEPSMSRSMVIGDLLALMSAVAFGFYSVAGRSQRHRYPLFTYAATVYGHAALWLLPAALLTIHPAGYNQGSLLALIGAALIPLALGHTLYNAALRRTHAATVNVIATQEVTGGVLLGAWILGEIPGANEIVGAAIALLGVVLVIL